MNLQVFKGSYGEIRTMEDEGNVWFVGKDVAEALGYSNTKDALLRHVDEEDKRGSRFTTSGQNREMTVINESGLYALVFGSQLPTAKQFKRWVTSEVLPSIHKHGAYMTDDVLNSMLNDPQTAIKMLSELDKERKAKREAVAKVEAQNRAIGLLKPKAEITDAFIERGHAVGFRDVAKELKVKENVLRRLLEDNRIAYRQGNRWKPYAKSMERGWMIVKDVMTDRFSVPQALFTMEGKDAIRRLLQKETENAAGTTEYTTETGKSLKAAMKSPGMLPKSSTVSQNGDTSHLRAHKPATKGNTRARNKKGSQRGYKAVSATTDNDTVDLLGCLGGNFF